MRTRCLYGRRGKPLGVLKGHYARSVSVVGTVAACVLTLCGTAMPAAGSARSLDSPTAAPRLPIGATELRTTISPWTSYSYNPYGAAGYLSGFYGAFDYSQLYLFYARLLPGKGKYGGYYLELSSGWDVKGNTLTINLRPNDRWTNGAPFTSKDVLVSMDIAGAELNGMWSSIASASAPSAHQVAIKLAPGAVAENVILDLAQMPIVPASQYKQFAPPGTQRNIRTYWRLEDPLHATAATQAAAAASAAYKALQKISTALPKYNPPTLLGDGPYKLVSISPSAMLLEKWNGFWDAKHITIPAVYISALNIAEQYGALEAGRIDYVDDTAFSDLQAEKLDSTPNRKYVIIKAPISEFGLLFSQKQYPWNLVSVRQALAYVIDRPKANKLTWGGRLIQNPTARYVDGAPTSLNPRYLSAKQLSSLNGYSYNPAKATSLLKSIGFTKREGRWYTPRKNLWKVTIYAPSGNSNLLDTTAVALVAMLKRFGITADTDLVPLATYGANQAKGEYPVTLGGTDGGFVNPLTFYDGTLTNKGLGLPATADVPGLGKVPIVSTLSREVSTAKPDQWRDLVWDWARYENQQLPVLSLSDNSFHQQYSSARYMDWPGAFNPLWTAWGPSLILFLQHGYLKLRS